MEAIRFIGDGDDDYIDFSVVHLDGVDADYTLCGITLDGDLGTAGSFDRVKATKITCPRCIKIIKACRGVRI